MKRKTSKAILLLCTVLLPLSACTLFLNEQGDTGTVTITIGSGNARAAAPDWLGPFDLNDLKHTIRAVDENGVEQYRAENLLYGDKSSFSLAPGVYIFYVEAFHSGELKAAGRAERIIHSGPNPAIIIKMEALPDLDGTVTIVNDDGAAITEPVITGTKLAAIYSGSEQGVSFQWYKNGNVILGETHSEYMPTEAGEYSVRVSLYGYNSKNSEPVLVDALYGDLSGEIIIEHGVIFIGMELTAVYSGSEGDVSYQWHLNDFPIMDATESTYIATEAGEYTVTVSLAGYNSKTSSAVIVDVIFNSTDNIEAYLTAQSNGNDEDNPISLAINMELSTANWTAILNAIGNSGKYIALNLSACTRSSVTPNGGLSSNGTFDPRTSTTYGMDMVVSLTLPEAADIIASGAFYNSLTKLRHFNTGNGITSIVDGAFDCYQLLTSVIIGSGVTTIGEFTFSNNQLTSVTIGNNVTTIGYSAFSDNQLTSIIIPDSVTTIGGFAFVYNQLTSVTIGNSVTLIENDAFNYNNLTSVIIPDSVTSIGLMAFSNNQLSSITIGANVAFTSGAATFARNFDIYYESNGKLAGTYTYDEGTSSWKYNGSIIRFTSINHIETYLENQSGGSSANPIPLPINMELSSANWIAILNAIGESGKYVNLDLSACTRSGSVTDGGLSQNGTFDPRTNTTAAGRDRIVSLTLPEVADSIAPGNVGISAFYSFTNLRHVNTGNGITIIGEYAFRDNQLTSVTIGNSVTTIGGLAFESNQLTSVTIGNSVISIGGAAFYGNQLTSVTIPNSVESIGDMAFYYNQLMTSVIIGNNVTSIGAAAFTDSQLTSITIGADVTFINSVSTSFDRNFDDYYESNGKQAGTYTYDEGTSSWKYNGSIIGFNISNPSEFGIALSAIQADMAMTKLTIIFTDDFAIDPQNLSGAAYQNKSITMKGNTPTRTISLASQGSIFTIGTDVELVLEDITLWGISEYNSSLINVDGGIFIMKGSAEVSGNRAESGGGVSINSNGTFIMQDNAIVSNNNAGGSGAGGVSVGDGIFIMQNNATVSLNSATGGGGGVFVRGNSIFVMRDNAVVSGNTAGGSGGGVTVGGGGSATFIMQGGIVSGNTGGNGAVVVANSSGTFRIIDGIVYGSGTNIDEVLRNNSGALYKGPSGIAEHGTFSTPEDITSTWIRTGNLTTTSDTIEVIDGVLQ